MGSPKWSRVEKKKSYLYRSVFNEAKRFHRSTARRLSREKQSASGEAVQPVDVQPEVVGALGELSVQQRAVIFLTYWEDLSPLGVADVLAIGEGSVKRHLARGRRRLKEVLDGCE